MLGFEILKDLYCNIIIKFKKILFVNEWYLLKFWFWVFVYEDDLFGINFWLVSKGFYIIFFVC